MHRTGPHVHVTPSRRALSLRVDSQSPDRAGEQGRSAGMVAGDQGGQLPALDVFAKFIVLRHTACLIVLTIPESTAYVFERIANLLLRSFPDSPVEWISRTLLLRHAF